MLNPFFVLGAFIWLLQTAHALLNSYHGRNLVYGVVPVRPWLEKKIVETAKIVAHDDIGSSKTLT